MTAGIALGPSLFGWIAPGLHASLFPDASLATLNLLGELGLIFYMFLVGLMLNLGHLREQSRVAIASSLASVAVPLVFGFALAMALYRHEPRPWPLSAFIGVSMSVTAFPVLVRILDEIGLLTTRLGSVAIAAAAFGDVAAWLMLAAILASKSLASSSPAITLAWLAAYIAAMLILRLVWKSDNLANALLIAIASSLATDWIGVHALFGAFFAGVVIRKTPEFVESARRTVEPLTLILFLPIFFAYTGLRTRIDLVWSKEMLMILVVAIRRKMAGSNARRTMGRHGRAGSECARNSYERAWIGRTGDPDDRPLDLGLITPRIFSMMVMMALVTTLMAAPLVRRFLRVEVQTTEYRTTSTL